ncbi:unnamed protein product, partial [Penicillium discolor]
MTVTVYTKPSCVQCNATYRALDAKSIDYEIHDLSEDPAALEQVKALGYLQAPVPLERRSRRRRQPGLGAAAAHPPRGDHHPVGADRLEQLALGDLGAEPVAELDLFEDLAAVGAQPPAHLAAVRVGQPHHEDTTVAQLHH